MKRCVKEREGDDACICLQEGVLCVCVWVYCSALTSNFFWMMRADYNGKKAAAQ